MCRTSSAPKTASSWHAPRQTVKTSALLALRDLLNGGTEGEVPRAGRFVVECKLLKDGRSPARTLERGLEQTAAYMDLCDADAGHLVIFDMREGRT